MFSKHTPHRHRYLPRTSDSPNPHAALDTRHIVKLHPVQRTLQHLPTLTCSLFTRLWMTTKSTTVSPPGNRRRPSEGHGSLRRCPRVAADLRAMELLDTTVGHTLFRPMFELMLTFGKKNKGSLPTPEPRHTAIPTDCAPRSWSSSTQLPFSSQPSPSHYLSRLLARGRQMCRPP